MKDIMRARKQATSVYPPAQLEARPDDYDLPPVLYMVCKVFADLKQKPNTDKFPGTLILRKYEAGEVICWQGDPGWTAFTIFTDADIEAIHKECQRLLAKSAEDIARATRPEAAEQSRGLLRALQQVRLPERPTSSGDNKALAAVYLDESRTATKKQGFFARLLGGKRNRHRSQPRFIEVDAPVSLAYGTRKADLDGGKIFGDWSCIYGTPRSATVVANRRCYVLEMLRNVLDKILGDAEFQKKKDREYTAEILENHLTGLSIFAELTPEQLGEIRQSVELKRYHDGEVVFDKGDPADSIYIVRRGLVKVLLNEWPLLAIEDIRNWELLSSLVSPTASAAQKYLGDKLTPDTRDLLGQRDLPRAERAVLVAGLNALLKERNCTGIFQAKANKLERAAALEGVLGTPTFKMEIAASFPVKEEWWSDQDWRRYNRLVLEFACPGVLRSVRQQGSNAPVQSGSEHILTYHARGDFFGELGVILDQPRSATCVAYVHPRPKASEVDAQGDKWRREEERIELVRIPGAVLKKLCEQYPSINARVQAEIKIRLERSQRQQARHTWQEAPPYQSDRFQQLGLIQGQKLMLIDLDRCTRCDECVQACVNTHGDGRSRLFLDGPRFGRFLVPSSCRACRDPVCLIGCPVGSIRRGDNLEILIEDWCIGCQLCAKNCPYGSIQMHDQGILSEDAHGWRFRPASLVEGDAWTKRDFSDRHWLEGSSPFLWDLDLEATLAIALKGKAEPAPTLCFRCPFQLEKDTLAGFKGLKIALDSTDERIQVQGSGRQAKITQFLPVWLNGTKIGPERWKVEQTQYVCELTDKTLLETGRNVLAVQATPAAGKRGLLLQVAVDEIRPSGVVLPLRAVVCDQCSSLPDQVQACVHACPHDAAMRVDAWTSFPVR